MIDIVIWYDFIDLFVIDCKVLALQGEKNKGSYCLVKNTSQSVEQRTVERKRLSMKSSLLLINENVGKQSQNA